MKYLRGTSDFHYKKAILKEQKLKGMITENQYFLFAEWLGERYEKRQGGWIPRFASFDPRDAGRIFTTAELWELYQKTYLGKKG